MIESGCVQGSAEWERLRLGIPTASRFSDILTPGLKLSASRSGLLCELLGEWATGERDPDAFGGNAWTERGLDMEADAADYYRLMRGLEPRHVGFCYRDEARMAGCSPDWLVGDDGGAEVKSPGMKAHIGYLLGQGVPAKYRLQVQGCLWVTGRAWWDFLSYHPSLPPVLVRSFPDEKVQAALDEHIPAFIEEMLAARETLRERGVKPALEREAA